MVAPVKNVYYLLVKKNLGKSSLFMKPVYKGVCEDVYEGVCEGVYEDVFEDVYEGVCEGVCVVFIIIL